MITARTFASIQRIDREQWNDCFPGVPEDWDYYLAVEQAGIEGFQWRYLALFDGSRLLAVAPAFITRYRLDTTVQGRLKRLTQRITRRWPAALQLALYAIGSPLAERCHVGIASHVGAECQADLLRRLLALARHDAGRFDIGLLAVKDVALADARWHAACRAAGLLSMPGLPGSTLAVRFGALDDYVGNLGKSTRKELRRLLRSPAPHIEWRERIDDVLPDIMRLYDATLARSGLQFERLGPDYFTGVLRRMPGRAACVLYWLDGRLVAFNLLLIDPARLVDKFFAHDPRHTRAHNLYARSWLVNVDYCIGQGIATYECGQAGYADKRRFGCRFQAHALLFRHRNPLLNLLLRLVRVVARPDRHDAALAAALDNCS